VGTQIQYRRGTNTQNDAFTGAIGEITVDTTAKTIRVHDGSTAGGNIVVNTTGVQTLSNKTVSNLVLSGTLSVASNVGLSGQYLSSTGTGVQWVTPSTSLTNIASGGSNVSVKTDWVNVAINSSNVAGFNSTGIFGVLQTASQTQITSVGVLTSLTLSGPLSLNTGSILNTGTNGVGNIGTVASTFNTVFARSTSAAYADLAEIYTSDQQYPAGTVVVFGGEAEVTQSHSPNDTRIAGVVSTNPAYLMNHDAVGVPVALQGRVPCRVLGPISKGDRVVASHIAGVAQALDPAQYQPGCIIGKALQAIDSTDISVIEVVVGRL